MSEQSANLALPYIAAAQAQKHVTHNEAIRRLDAFVQLVLESATAPAPPPSPAEGARWFVPSGATGAFAGRAGMIAAYEAGAFDFLPVSAGFLAFIRDEGRLAVFDGGTLRRSFTLASPDALYAAADEIADFGAPQGELTVRVAQLSASVGAGAAVTATVAP